MVVQVKLAGRVGIDVDGVAVGSRIGPLGRLVLAYLVWARHRPVPRDELADLLWGDDLPASWGQMLRGIVSQLRVVLAAAGLAPMESLITASGTCQLHLPAGVTVDVEEAADAVEAAHVAQPDRAFELASGAVAVASRRFLPGASGLWVERRQAELRDLHLRALEALAAAASARSRWAAAVAAAEEAVTIEAFRESGYLLLMAAHADAGNRDEALRAYERCRRTLAEELGVAPSPATEAAYLGLLGAETEAQRPSARPPPLPVPAALAVASASILVGREAELARLSDALERAATGERQTALISGDPGIGKTALVAAMAGQAQSEGARIIYGRCDEDLGVAYQPFAEALGELVAARPGDLAAVLATYGGDLLRLGPDLAHRIPDAVPTIAADPEADRFALFEAVAAVFAAASRVVPLVIVVDDLHWATNATLLLMRHLVRSPTPAALMVVGTYRHSEVGPSHPLSAILADLRREPRVERIGLGGLDEAAVCELVAAAADEPPEGEPLGLARAIHARTAGNPFFVRELLRYLADTGAVVRKEGHWSYYADVLGLRVPEGVREVVARRLQRLSPATNRSLVWASVVGSQFDLDVLEALADAGDGDGVLDSIEEAVAARLVVEVVSGRYTFAHALVRDAIYSGLTATRRARLHRRVGEALEGLPGEATLRLPALAHHFINAASSSDASRGADYALAAARQAFTQAAWEDAIAVLERGLEALEVQEPPDLERRADLLLTLTEAWARLWDPAQTVAASLRAAEAARTIGSAERLGKAARWYYANTSQGGGGGTGIDPTLAEEALAGLGDDQPAIRALVLARLAHCQTAASWDGFDAASREALALARRSGDPEAIGVALDVRCQAASASPALDEQLALAEELVSAAPPGGWDGWRSGHAQRAVARLRLGDRAGFDADTDAVERIGAVQRFWAIRITAQLWRATQALLDGRFGEVEALAAEAAVAWARSPQGDVYAIQMFRLRFEQGRLDEGMSDLERAVADHPDNSTLAAMLAAAHAELGAHEDARRQFDRLAEREFARVAAFVARGVVHPWAVVPSHRAMTLAYLAEVAAILGDPGRAAMVYDCLTPLSGQVLVAGAVAHTPGAVDRHLGQLAATLGRHDQAEAFYLAALTLEAQLSSPPLLARTRYWFARMLLDRNGPRDRERATGLLVDSLATAQRLGMAGLATQSRALLATA